MEADTEIQEEKVDNQQNKLQITKNMIIKKLKIDN